MNKLKRFLKIAGKILLVVVLLVVVVNLAFRIYWGRRVEAQLAALKASGAPLTPADLAGPPIPDDKNAAIIYDKAFKLMSGKAFKSDIDLIYKVSYPPKGGEVRPKTWEDARAAIGRYKEIFVLLDEALARPECRFPLPFEFCMSKAKLKTAQQINHFVKRRFMRVAGGRQAVRLLCAKAVIDAHDGESAVSVATIEKAIAINETGGERFTIVGILVKTAQVKIVLNSIRRAISYGKFSEAQLASLSNALARIDINNDYRHAFEGERVQFIQQHMSMNKTLTLYHLQYDVSANLSFIDSQLTEIGLSYKDARARETADERRIPRLAILTRILAPVFQRAAMDRFNTHAEIAIGRTALALEAYKVKFGSYPRSLGEIKSMKLPADPFSDKSLVYKPDGKGYVLYSVGPNQRDDGGAKLESVENGISRGDIVWGSD